MLHNYYLLHNTIDSTMATVNSKRLNLKMIRCWRAWPNSRSASKRASDRVRSKCEISTTFLRCWPCRVVHEGRAVSNRPELRESAVNARRRGRSYYQTAELAFRRRHRRTNC